MEMASEQEMQWFVLRDLKRPNAKFPAYKQLAEKGFRVFTPMTSKIVIVRGRRERVQVPFISDLLFVLSERDNLDPIVAQIETLQYRYVKGASYCTPMIVPARDMNRFMAAITHVKTPKYYSPEEITPAMYGAKVKMVCNGSLNGYEGRLLKVRGSGKKRFLVELPDLLSASVEISSSDYIEIIED